MSKEITRSVAMQAIERIAISQSTAMSAAPRGLRVLTGGEIIAEESGSQVVARCRREFLRGD